MEFLFSVGVDVNAKDNNPANGKTALHWAVINGKESCVSFLLQKKALLIPDLIKKKTPEEYANEGANENIKTMFSCRDSLAQLQKMSEELIETGIKSGIG